ncbi:hypothetical protein GCM10010403_52140 [Glycomyces rutgersensis]
MVLLHKREIAIPEPKACSSDAVFWVVTDGGAQRGVCGPHLPMLMGQMTIEHPRTADEWPAPGVPCEYMEIETHHRYAALVRQIPTSFGDVRLYRLSEPLNGFEYVTVSAVTHLRPETYIFGSDETGSMDESYELPGSLPGVMNHTKALESAGYIVAEASR